MVIHPLTPTECVEVLTRATVGRLACARDDQPYVVPISFYFDGTASLYSFAMLGQKIFWMRENPKICVEIDEIADRFQWTTIVITGEYDEIGDSPEESRERRRISELLRQRRQWWLPAAAKVIAGEEHDTPVFYRIRITSVTGRRAAAPPPSAG